MTNRIVFVLVTALALSTMMAAQQRAPQPAPAACDPGGKEYVCGQQAPEDLIDAFTFSSVMQQLFLFKDQLFLGIQVALADDGHQDFDQSINAFHRCHDAFWVFCICLK